MPKIIENVREQLLAETRRQIAERGYSDTTVRSVAASCGLGVGTVYNYFSSKEMLIATIVYDDWKVYLADIASLPCYDVYTLFRGIYDSLQRFAEEHKALFSDATATKTAAGSFAPRHKLLREQIASFILPTCERNEVTEPAFVAAFVAESLIGWSMENADFDTLYPLLEKVIKK